ncbi:uncharacterized protein GGS22DRAFT_155987 [Annulohypoxylon maeteangense]|uniref:uncharacterized protein n=1 Tax=Annulohypoxylon maeteangense TaxID=1927788 RepID=UPI002007FB25|nr:uncharacterized protein GGS22DRAFT_155987 [Annulohypoxylon maeteangense]KAI0888481.1 hypothetical protein GGS22DRAFT_155987 [Annulohypoxylon maeteangense]
MASSPSISTNQADPEKANVWKNDSIEERIFSASLICLEGHYNQAPTMGSQSLAKVTGIVSKTLEKTHTFKDVREILSRNVRVWIWLRRAVSAAICDLNEKSLGVRSVPFVQTRFLDITTPEVTALIIKNYVPLKEALQMLNKLMHIARNLLVTTDPGIPQDLSAAIHFDHEVYESICLCVNVTSKGIDGEMPEDEASRSKLNEITELCKKVLVTSLQQAHNWIAKNDRNKMSFWYKVLIESPDADSNPGPEDRHESVLDYPAPRSIHLRDEISNWVKRSVLMCDAAVRICKEFFDSQCPEKKDQWLPQRGNLGAPPRQSDDYNKAAEMVSKWDPEQTNKAEQDRAYGRVSHELDKWWYGARIPNSNDWSLTMYSSIDSVPQRIKECEANLMQRYAAAEPQEEPSDVIEHPSDDGNSPEWQGQAPQANQNFAPEYDEYEEEADDDDSYGEGPMTGLLTEVPNILDPKQIEALHMIVKSCILDSAGSGFTPFGENLQQTRCRIFLATDCGRNLLREMLVFIAVWEKDEQSLIFQISSQIVQAIHENSLIPYAWMALRSPKDIISPAQTVLLRLITFLFRTALAPPKDYNPFPDPKTENIESILANEDVRLGKMLNYLYGIFRSRIVPECVALMQIQGEVRKGRLDPADFPVDNWDLERAKDGLVQYLDFLYTVADIFPLRQHLIDYEAVYELLRLLEGLDVGVEKAPFPGTRRNEPPTTPSTTTSTPQASSSSNPPPPPPPPPPISDPPHEFPWSGIKGQVLSILAALLQPPPGQSSPGNPTVQLQILQHNGIVALLNCCLYDDNNRFCRERTQLCLKWLMDGCPDASAFLQNLVSANQQPVIRPPPGTTQSIRVDGVSGEVRVQVRSSSAPVAGEVGEVVVSADAASASLRSRLEENKSRSEELVQDLLALTVVDENGKMTIAPDEDETEDDDFI